MYFISHIPLRTKLIWSTHSLASRGLLAVNCKEKLASLIWRLFSFFIVMPARWLNTATEMSNVSVFVCLEPGKNVFQEQSSRSMNSSWSPCVSWARALHCSRWYKMSPSAACLNLEEKNPSFSISLSLKFMNRLVSFLKRDGTHLSHSRSNKILCCSEHTIAFAILCWRNCDLKKEEDLKCLWILWLLMLWL